jgi:hypothetical protein
LHVLSKLFVALVALLTAALVPMVVTYAYNEDSYKAKWQESRAEIAALQGRLDAQSGEFDAVKTGLSTRAAELEVSLRAARSDAANSSASVERLRDDLSQANGLKAQIANDLSTLASAVSANQDLTESLIDELASIRQEALAAERRRVELDETYRDTAAQLEVAVAARRALQEELQRMKDDQASSMDTIGRYIARFGELDAMASAGMLDAGIEPDRNLDATIVQVRRGGERSYAEINAGSRDGVKVGWIATVGRGGDSVARLRITAVDINRATGVLEMESEAARGLVSVGDRVLIRTNN